MTRGSALFRLTVRSILLDRKTVVVLGFLILLLALPAYWVQNPPSSEDHAPMEFFLIIVVLIYLQFIVLYICLLFASSLLTSEVEDRTMVYLLSRPISRLEVLLYKYAAYVVSIWTLFALAATFNYIILAPSDADGIGGNLDILALTLGALLMGVMAWGAVFMMFASIFKNPLVPGFLTCIFWESLVANMPGNIPMGTVTYQLRTFLLNSSSRIPDILGDDLPNHASYSAGWAFGGTVMASIALLLISWWFVSRRDFP